MAQFNIDSRFGQSVFFNCWEHVVASNGYIAVRMHA